MNRDNNWILWILIILAGLYILSQCNNKKDKLTTDSSLPDNMLSETGDLSGGLNGNYSGIDFTGGGSLLKKKALLLK